MFDGLQGVSAKEVYGVRVNALSAGGRSVPRRPGHARGQTTTPLCLCELQRQGDRKRK